MTISADTMLVEALKRWPDDPERRHAFLAGAEWAFDVAGSETRNALSAIEVVECEFREGTTPAGAQRQGYQEAKNDARAAGANVTVILRSNASAAQQTNMCTMQFLGEGRTPIGRRLLGDLAEILMAMAHRS